MDKETILQSIQQLKQQKNAVILAHYYVPADIQDIADYLGDSLGLSQQAASTQADIILFCSVHFMAETASIISPNKKVLIPTQGAGCSLAESITAANILSWKAQHPNGLVVSYVNTTAEVKAVTDYCVTSANALKIVEQLPENRPILFGPDKHLGKYIQLQTGREMDIWQGDCYVHRYITPELVYKMLQQYPEAEMLIHPESAACTCQELLQHKRVVVGSTTSILTRPAKSSAKQFLIATEAETLHQLHIQYPHLSFIPVVPQHPCRYMKLITLTDVWHALQQERYEVKVPVHIREKAILPIERMLALS